MNEIIVNPEIQALQDEIGLVKSRISSLVIERDNLKYVECKNIETEYMLSIGVLEYKAYEKEVSVYKLKRKIELIQQQINLQKKVDLPSIEEKLAVEYAEYEKKLAEKLNKMNSALHHGSLEKLTNDEERELKRLYRALVKKLHPDLNPGIRPEKVVLFQRAVEAYEAGNLFEMRIIATLAEESAPKKVEIQKLDLLKKEVLRLKNVVKGITADIEVIKSKFPYNVKQMLQDPIKKKERITVLEKTISQFDELIEHYKSRIEELQVKLK